MQPPSEARALQNPLPDNDSNSTMAVQNMDTASVALSMETVIVLAVEMIIEMFGIILNILVIVTYFHRRRKSLFTFLVGLAFIDLCNCLVLTMDIARQLGTMYSISDDIWCRAFSYVTFAGNLTSACFVVLLAFCRFTKVQIQQTALPYRNNVWLIIGTTMCCLLICAPILFSRNYTAVGTCYSTSRIHAKNSSVDIYITVFSVVNITCLFIGLIVMILIYTKLARAASVRIGTSIDEDEISKSSPNSRQRKSVTFSLMTTDSDSSNMKKAESPTSRMSLQYPPGYNFLAPSGSVSGPQMSPTMLNSVVYFADFTEFDFRKPKVSIDSRTSSSNASSTSIFKPIKQYTFPTEKRSSRSSAWSEHGFKVGTPVFTTVMIVFAITIYFFHFPYVCMNIVHATFPGLRGQTSGVLEIVFDLLERSYIVLFVLNPIVYGIFNRNFFRDLNRTCCRRCGKNSTKMRRNSFQVRRSSQIIEGTETRISVPSIYVEY